MARVYRLFMQMLLHWSFHDLELVRWQAGSTYPTHTVGNEKTAELCSVLAIGENTCRQYSAPKCKRESHTGRVMTSTHPHAHTHTPLPTAHSTLPCQGHTALPCQRHTHCHQ
eukprot:scpid2533/ scgid2428/ 